MAGNSLTVEEVSSREPSFDEAVLSNSRPDVTVGTVMVSANPFVSIILPAKPHIHLDIDIILSPCLHLRAVVCSCLLKSNPFFNIYQQWQTQNHKGFVKSYTSSAQHGPIAKQHGTWRRIGRQLTLNKILVTTQNRDHRLKPDQLLIILGKKDPIIVEEALVADATECLGADAQFVFFDVGHELPITHGEEVVDIIWAFWNLE